MYAESRDFVLTQARRLVSFRRLSCTLLCTLLAPVLLLGWKRTSGPTVLQVRLESPLELQCPSIFRLSTFQHGWEDSLPDLDTCTSRTPKMSEVQQCIAKIKSDIGPIRVVFVGDSRLRNIFDRMRYRLDLPLLKRTFGNSRDGSEYFNSKTKRASSDYWEEFSVPLRKGSKPRNVTFGSYRSGNEDVQLEFWWRVYLSRSFVSKVAELVDECAHHPERCPALVVLDSGLWSARRFDLTETASSSDWTLSYREGLREVLPHLRRLATATRVLWKIDEPVFSQEVRHGKPGVIMSSLGVIQTIIYGLVADIPGLTVWSAMVPETVRFYWKFCWTRYKKYVPFENGRLFLECSNKFQVGVTLLDAHVAQLLSYLCREAGGRSQSCCGWPDTSGHKYENNEITEL